MRDLEPFHTPLRMSLFAGVGTFFCVLWYASHEQHESFGTSLFRAVLMTAIAVPVSLAWLRVRRR